VGTYRDGELDGPVDEVDVDGFVLSRGTYAGGEPTGTWTFFYRDGGRLRGPLERATGLVHGTASYHYPDDTELWGTWAVSRDAAAAAATFQNSTHTRARTDGRRGRRVAW
jgi:hypothetical protein